MAVSKTFSDTSHHGEAGRPIITFVAPAPKGCNMRCPFCAIAQRRERNPIVLRHEDYLALANAMLDRFPASHLLMQGDEPLLPESWATSKALLALGKERGVPIRGIVTNGWYLADRACELVELDVRVAVSLDSPFPSGHDRLRRTSGAFANVIEGLAKLLSLDPSYVEVASVLFPKRDDLTSMPAFLAKIGVYRWVVTPLLIFADGKETRFAESDCSILERVFALVDIAMQHDIELVLDDELNGMREVIHSQVVPEGFLRLHSITRFAREGLVRVTPNGRIAVGGEVMRAPVEQLPFWNPQQETAPDVVDRIINPALAERQKLAV